MSDHALQKQISGLLHQNQQHAGKHQFTVPALRKYPFQWLWDSCFHAIIYARLGEMDNAKQELLSLTSHQFANGMIPHMIYWGRRQQNDDPMDHWGKPDTSALTQPPLLAHAAWSIYQTDHDKAFVRTIYPALKRFLQYLLTDRDRRGIHLLSTIDPDESGEDNSPRFDAVFNLPPRPSHQQILRRRHKLVEENRTRNFDGRCASNFWWVRDVPFNAITIASMRYLSNMAELLGYPDDMTYYQGQIDKMSPAMRTCMFEDGAFWPTWDEEPKRIRVKSWHLFAPMYAKLFRPDEAATLVQRYLFTDGFDTPYAVPTIATDEPSYNPENFWRGPVWMASNWLICHGLCAYGMSDQAATIQQGSRALIEQSGFREHFSPTTGKGAGAKDFTWSGLVLDMNG